ncbi:MAG: hypothetical protein ACKO9U_25900 [Dolichospermum sp.]
MIEKIFSRYRNFGFSGSRLSVPKGCQQAANLIPENSTIFVGCAKGVDEYFRQRFPEAKVSKASDFGSDKGSFVQRSAYVISFVKCRHGLWVSFPDKECPIGLFPSDNKANCFCGMGSGTWASLAYALGWGVPCLVYLGNIPKPRGWELFPINGSKGWYGCSVVADVPSPSQLILF